MAATVVIIDNDFMHMTDPTNIASVSVPGNENRCCGVAICHGERRLITILLRFQRKQVPSLSIRDPITKHCPSRHTRFWDERATFHNDLPDSDYPPPPPPVPHPIPLSNNVSLRLPHGRIRSLSTLLQHMWFITRGNYQHLPVLLSLLQDTQ